MMFLGILALATVGIGLGINLLAEGGARTHVIVELAILVWIAFFILIRAVIL